MIDLMRYPDGTGQIIEWLVWGAIAARSANRLHVFLPVRDTGVDAVIHRRGGTRLVAVQVKGRTRLEDGVFRIHLQEAEATDDEVRLIGTFANGDGPSLAEPVLIADVATVRRLAPRVPYGSRSAYSVEIPWPPGQRTHWHPYCVSLDAMAAQLLGDEPLPRTAPDIVLGEKDQSHFEGFVAEMELLRRTAELDDITLFHAYPDDEFAEYIVRHRGTGGMLALQVKCVSVDARGEGTSRVKFGDQELPWSDRAAVVVFGRRAGGVLDAGCLVVPATELGAMLRPAGEDRLGFDVRFAPGEPWLVGLDALASRLGALARDARG